ncbi:Deoxycytidine triphosphate deaminase [Roseimaritima multifibrata]|uniref:Deoxycytidine triphosphate deaminase n=1 Tax=Roseimaritima multifibrata TaxID=1930274 RepID=A0A517MAT3_9BACT|nr:dCTP deaminase [Roseimaritima multifibrata]QDS91993.1 Deoxycytidine triphosphate deaminase [Roseimaritima multifibrata]
MILSGDAIQKKLGSDIHIEPFDSERLNPNSYNLRLHDELLVYEEIVLDMRTPNRYRRMSIPPEGLVLQPDRLYLGRTIERLETHNLVPMVSSRSSLTRLGLFVGTNSGFGDVGYSGHWTLELYCVQPIRIYAGVQVCEIFYHELCGEVDEYCSSKYQNANDIQPSLMFREIGSGDESEQQLELDFDRLADHSS